jgi:hypothetical protein
VLGELPWRRHGRSSSAKPISRYGALSWTGFLPTGAVRFGELTWGVFSRCGAPKQGARQRGSSSDLRRRWWGASRGSSQRGRAKWVRHQLQITDVRLLELEKLLTRHDDGKGYLGLASVFHEILARGSSIYRGFGSMISCVRRTLSPSHLGFSFNWIALGFSVGEESSVQRRCSRVERGCPGWAARLGWGRPLWLGRAGLRRSGGGKWLAGPDSVSSRVSAQYRIGIRKTLFFFKYFYNLQTDLNSIQI